MTTSTVDASRVVLCGSMSALQTMRDVAKALECLGVSTVLPDADDPEPNLTCAEVDVLKRRASMRHIERIRHKNTYGILVVNVDKYGVHNYVGPNAFAEIAVCFAFKRRIFLYQDYPTDYADELRAWEAVALQGDLTPLANAFEMLRSQTPPGDQLQLFT